MASAIRGINQRPAYVFLFVVAAAFIMLSFTRTSHRTEDSSPPIQISRFLTYSETSRSDGSEEKEETVTGEVEDCILDRKFLPERSRPLLLLLSFPGSGNTWVRFLIERSTGIYTGSLYNDVGTGNKDSSVWRKSSPCSKKTLVVKSHGWENFDKIKSGGETCKVDGVILVIRNPYGAILADFNRMKTGKTGTASVSQFLSPEWREFAEGRASKWLKTNKKGIGVHKKLVVFYEDLVSNTDYELRRMLDFLQVSHDERRIACLLKDTVGKYKRVHKNLDINPYSAEINKTIDKNIREFRGFLQNNTNLELPPYESSSPS